MFSLEVMKTMHFGTCVNNQVSCLWRMKHLNLSCHAGLCHGRHLKQNCCAPDSSAVPIESCNLLTCLIVTSEQLNPSVLFVWLPGRHSPKNNTNNNNNSIIIVSDYFLGNEVTCHPSWGEQKCLSQKHSAFCLCERTVYETLMLGPQDIKAKTEANGESRALCWP